MLLGHVVPHIRTPRDFHVHIAGMEGPHERSVIAGDAVELELRQVSLGRTDIGLFHSSAGMTVRSTGLRSDSYLVQFPLDGTVNCEIDGESFTVAPGGGLVIAPMQRVSRSESGGWTLVFRLMVSHLRARIEAKLGRATREQLQFDPVVSGENSALHDFALLVVEAVDRRIASAGSPIARLLEDGFADLLIALQPHSAQGSLEQSLYRVRAARVRAVEAFIDAHLDEAFGVEDLAEAASCGVRALQETFREICGTTPMDFARFRRLAAARSLLEAAHADARISDVAARCGFQHVSRFAATYRERFGESPSVTLRRSAERKPAS
jgi:AraC-like DNA-binding protein